VGGVSAPRAPPPPLPIDDPPAIRNTGCISIKGVL
jgi:hypothetical protein